MTSPPPSSSVESSPSNPSARVLPTASSLKSNSLKNPATQEVFQSIVKGRKSWKTLKGGEVVWPPELEAALIEGLENYQPDDSRETRLLGRFPMRNKIISDWIFEKTGKVRSAKQVGSRLQQLRDTCGGKRLLKLLTPVRPPVRKSSLSPRFHHNEGHLTYGPPSLLYDSESSSDSSISSPTSPTEAHATLQNLLYRGVEPRVDEIPSTIVYIDLLPDQTPSHISPEASWASTSEALAEERSWLEQGYKIERASQQPRRLCDIDPTITLVSPAATSAQSHFTVHADGGVVFSETTELEPLHSSSTLSMDGSLLYKTPLIPTFWDAIVRSPDASKYVIIQEVTADASSSSSPPTSLFSAMYKFNHVTLHPPAHSGSVSTDHGYQNYPIEPMTMPAAAQGPTDFEFDNLALPIDPQTFSDMMVFSKPTDMFPLGTYIPQDDWSSCSSNESVYPSPVDGTFPMSFALPGAVGEQHLQPQQGMPAFPPTDVSDYASFL